MRTRSTARIRTPGSWLILIPLALTACVPSENEGYKKLVVAERGELPPPAAPAAPPVVAGAGGGQAAAKLPTLAAADMPPGVTQAMIEQGAQSFATVCSACHGPNGTGTPAAPALNDKKWINISGSFDEIDRVITEGVPHPKEHAGAMPPKGGGNFDAEQIRAISAYVYALSHGSGA